MKEWPVIILALGQLATCISGLQAADVGAIDWHLPLIGAPRLSPPATPPLHRFRHVAAPLQARKRSLIFTVTDKNVLAALEPASGSIVWRSRYESEDASIQYLLCTPESVLIASRPDGSDLHSLDATTGALNWHVEGLPAQEERASAGEGHAICWDDEAGQDAIALFNGAIRRIDGLTGRAQWIWTQDESSHEVYRLVPVDERRIAVLALRHLEHRTEISIRLLEAATGALSPLRSTISVPSLSPSNFILPASTSLDTHALAWIDGGRLYTLAIAENLSKPALFSESSAFSQLHDVGLLDRGIFVAQREDGSAAVFAVADGLLQRTWDFPDAVASSLFSSFVDRRGESHVAHLSYSSVLQLGSLQVLSLAPTEASPSGMLTGHTFPFDIAAFGAMTAFAIEVSPPQEYAVASRVFIATVTGSVQAWEGAHRVWMREEGLANLDVSPVFLDVTRKSPFAASADASRRSISTPFSARIRHQVLSLSNRLTTSLLRAPSISSRAVSTQYLVFVASSSSRVVFALDLEQRGATRWRTAVPLASSVALSWQKLFLVHDASGNKGPVIAAVALLRHQGSTTTRIFEFDGLSGEILRHRDETPSIAGATLSGVVERPSSSRSVSLTLVNAFDAIHIYPSLSSSPNDWVTWVEHRETSLVGRKTRLNPREQELEIPLWQFKAPSADRVHMVMLQSLGSIASPGRVLGNRSTLLKYLNPNLVAVATLHPTTSSASVYILDSASGAVVHKINHVGDVDVEKKVRLVFRDNWLLYTYQVAGDLAQTSRIVSVEIFHLSAGSTDANRSGLRPEEPSLRVLSRSFVSAQELNVVAVTHTKLGISAYSAIFINSLGQVVAIPRRSLDTRRTYGKSTKEDQEEMLLPYDAMLPPDPRWTVSHRYELLGIDRVSTSPGRRESESIVFASGLDLFGTRLAPSRSFDVLSPAFNKVQLVVTITSLTLALAVARTMVKTRQQRQKWYTVI